MSMILSFSTFSFARRLRHERQQLDEFETLRTPKQNEHTTMQCKRIKRNKPIQSISSLLLREPSDLQTPSSTYLAKIGLLMFKNRIASNRSLSPFTVMFALRNCNVKRSIVYCGQRGTASTEHGISDEDR